MILAWLIRNRMRFSPATILPANSATHLPAYTQAVYAVVEPGGTCQLRTPGLLLGHLN